MHYLMQCLNAIICVHLQKGFQVCVYINHCIYNPVSPAVATSLAMKTL